MVLLVDMIPAAVSGESNQDSEPSVTVDPADPLHIAGTAFTPDPGGSTNAPIYVSTDGGRTWLLNPIVPSQPGGSTGDITVRFASSTHDLYAGDLALPGIPMDVLRTTDLTSPTVMTLLETRANEDQPFVQAITVPSGLDAGKDRIYIGHNDFNLGSQTAALDVCLDAAAAAPTFTTISLDSRGTAGQDGPQVRPAVHPDGTVYAAFYGWRSQTPAQVITSDIVICRDDNWAAGGTMNALVDTGDNQSGVRVAQGITFTWNQYLGQERTGGDLTIAVDPRNSSTVYLAYADQQPAGYTVHVRRSLDRGATWSGDLLAITNATNSALAINRAGHVGLLYQRLTGAVGSQRFETHIQRSPDGTSWNDVLLATTPSDMPVAQFDPYLGDFEYLAAVGNDFYGIFCANNTPDLTDFPSGVIYQRNANFGTHTLLANDGVTPVAVSIDPFFFRVGEAIGGSRVGQNADGRLEVFVIGTDSAVWHNWQVSAGGAWSGWASLGGIVTSQPVVYSNFDSRLEIFARGTDSAIWHNWQVAPNDGWSGWNSLGGILMDEPAVASNWDGRLEIFGIGSDSAVYHNWQTTPNGGWSGWASLGGIVTTNPAVFQNQDGRLEIFARGTDSALWHNWQTTPGGGWSGWYSLGGIIESEPAVYQNFDGRLEVFAIGTDSALWHIWQTTPNGGWSGWDSLGGVLDLDSRPAVFQNQDGRLEVFVPGTDSGLWHNWQTTPGGGWSGWNPLGGVLESKPVVIENSDGRLEVFVMGTDSAVWHIWQSTPNGGWSGWDTLGGIIMGGMIDIPF